MVFPEPVILSQSSPSHSLRLPQSITMASTATRAPEELQMGEEMESSMYRRPR